jgi:uncharacterized peroxidase-related enzyme
MPRIPQATVEEQRELLDAVQRQLGRVPNLYRSMAASPAALRGYLAFRDALTRGVLGARTSELLALLVAAENSCAYCVSAHTMRGSLMKITEEELLAARRAESGDPHTQALLRTAREIMRTHGRVDDEVLGQIRDAGVTDTELAEVTAHVALHTFSNYFNHLARPELDFPPAPDVQQEEDSGMMTATGWRVATAVELIDGYTVLDAADKAVSTVCDVRISFEGGFAHIDVPGQTSIQVVSAPAVRRISYPHP